MGSAKLVAEITAETGGFEAGLNRADAAADKFTSKVSKKFSKAFGVAFLASEVFKVPQHLMEQAEAISEASSKLGVNTDEYQLLAAAAKDAGMEVEAFIQSNAKQGIMLDTVVSKLVEYRKAIQMSQQDVGLWAEMKTLGMALARGIAAPVAFAAKQSYLAAVTALDVGGFVASGLTERLFGRSLIAPSEDFLISMLSRFGYAPHLEAEHAKALPLPAGYGQQKKYDRLAANLMLLDAQEEMLKGEERRRAGTHLWEPGRTDWQQLGAAVWTPSMVVTQLDETNSKLDDIHKEQQKTRQELEKLRTGNPAVP